MNTQKEKQWLQLLAQNGMYLRNIPLEEITEEMCEVALKNNGLALQYVPTKFKTYHLYCIAVSQNPMALQFVQEDERDENLSHMAVLSNGMTLEFVREDIKTYEMCMDAILEVAGHIKTKETPLKYVPEKFKDQNMVMYALQGLSDGLQKRKALCYVPEKYITPRFLKDAGIGHMSILWNKTVKFFGPMEFIPMACLYLGIALLLAGFIAMFLNQGIKATIILSFSLFLFVCFLFFVLMHFFVDKEPYLSTRSEYVQHALETYPLPVSLRDVAYEACRSIRRTKKLLKKADIPYIESQERSQKCRYGFGPSYKDSFYAIGFSIMSCEVFLGIFLRLIFPEYFHIVLISLCIILFSISFLFIRYYTSKHKGLYGWRKAYHLSFMEFIIVAITSIVCQHKALGVVLVILPFFLKNTIDDFLVCKKMSHVESEEQPSTDDTKEEQQPYQDMPFEKEENMDDVTTYVQKIQSISTKEASQRVMDAMLEVLDKIPDSVLATDTSYAKLAYEIVHKYESLPNDIRYKNAEASVNRIADVFYLSLEQKAIDKTKAILDEIEINENVFHRLITMNGVLNSNAKIAGS